MKNKKFDLKVEKEEKFHDAIIKFMKNNNNDFKYYIITEMYSFIKK